MARPLPARTVLPLRLRSVGGGWSGTDYVVSDSQGEPLGRMTLEADDRWHLYDLLGAEIDSALYFQSAEIAAVSHFSQGVAR